MMTRIKFYEVQTSLILKCNSDDLKGKDYSLEKGSHVITLDGTLNIQVFAKPKKQADCVYLKTNADFITSNPAIFKPIDL